jgi:HAD superfamily hydrolase (TIGR01509 family)
MLEYFNYQFDAYIFDCDGTLAESMYMHFQAWSYSLQVWAPEIPFTWDLFRSMAGMGLHHTIELVSKRFNVPLDAKTLLDEQYAYCKEHMHLMEPNHEIVDFARHLAEKKIPIAVASGGFREMVHNTLEVIGVKDLFPVVVTQDDVFKGKPDPEIFLLAAHKLGIAPEKCLVLEDSLLGIQAAIAAGMGSVLIRAE